MFDYNNDFYAFLAGICIVALCTYFGARLMGALRLRIWNTMIIIVLGVSVLTAAGYGIISGATKAYDDSIPVMNDTLDLNLYAPFTENTRAVSLEEEASWEMSEPLLKIDGATAFYPLYAAFAQAVYPEANYPNVLRDAIYDTDAYAYVNDFVVCTTTPIAYNRLINGETDLIFVYGPSEEQLRIAEGKGVDLTFTLIGYDAFVFFVNAQNPVDNLSSDDIRRIYSSQARSWRAFGWRNVEIMAYQRPENSGSQTIMIDFMGDVPLMPSYYVADSMANAIKLVSYKNYQNAIGYSFLFFATEMVQDNQIKLLSIDGVAPTRENVANGTYPLTYEFYAVTAGTDNPNAEQFIEWILSPQGQYLVEKTGYTPVG